MEKGNDELSMSGNSSEVIIIAMASASFVVTMYHLILLCCTHQRHVRGTNSEQQRARSMRENSLVSHLIPSHKYEKKKKNNDDDVAEGDEDEDEDEDETCAVCLGEFEEGEDVRTLPQCMHTFHVACIDMWLYSHSTCPVCRGQNNLLGGKVGAILIAIGSASFVVTIYHLITIFCRYHQPQAQAQAQSMEHNTLVLPHLIPSHKYEKKKKNNGDIVDEDATCAVCLGEFEQGEELRTLPECMHTFHVPCIDPWLHSHSSCPLCRSLATPSAGGELNNAHHTTLDMVLISLVQNLLPLAQILM